MRHLLTQMQIAPSAADLVMPHPFFDGMKIDAGFRKFGSGCMPHTVNAGLVGCAGTFFGARILAQTVEQSWREQCPAILAVFPVDNTQHHAAPIDIGERQVASLAHAQADRIGSHKHGAMFEADVANQNAVDFLP